MNGLRALRLALEDVWEESFVVVGMGLIGGVLSLFILPIPFVLAGHYGVAHQIEQEQFAGWRLWIEKARSEAVFFYKWLFLVLLATILLAGNIYFYSQLDTSWGIALGWLAGGTLLLWLFPQPIVPALYLRQSDRKLRTALRNAALLALGDPLSVLIMWVVVLLLGLVAAYLAWPLLLPLPAVLAIYSTRLVGLQLARWPSTKPDGRLSQGSTEIEGEK